MKFGGLRSVVVIAISLMVLVVAFNNCMKPPGKSSLASEQEVGTAFSGQLKGNLQYVDSSGLAWGYALDPLNSGKSVRVYFYADGPAGQGVPLGDTLANVEAVGPNAGHFFSFRVPPSHANGSSHIIYVYGQVVSQEYLIAPSPMNYVSYTPKAQAVYDQQLNGLVRGSCNGCHSWNLQSLFYGPLLSPSPGMGGSATNNLLINKIGGGNHNGNTFCTSKTDFYCAEIQKWWNAEFN